MVDTIFAIFLNFFQQSCQQSYFGCLYYSLAILELYFPPEIPRQIKVIYCEKCNYYKLVLLFGCFFNLMITSSTFFECSFPHQEIYPKHFLFLFFKYLVFLSFCIYNKTCFCSADYLFYGYLHFEQS